MPVEIRAASADDIDAILSLWAESSERSSTNSRAALEKVLAFPGATIIVAVQNGDIVGTVLAAWNGWRGTMYRLAVAQTHRRRGIARRLVEQAEAFLHEQGAERVGAIVLDANEPGLAFWRSMGYEGDFGGLYHAKDL